MKLMKHLLTGLILVAALVLVSEAIRVVRPKPGGAGSIGTVTKSKDPCECGSDNRSRICVCNLPLTGKSCTKKGKTIAHRDVSIKFSKKTAKICMDGQIKTLATPLDFTGGSTNCPVCECQTCTAKDGKLFSQLDDVPPKSRRKTLKRQCLDGTIYLVNTALGIKSVDRSADNPNPDIC